MTRRMLRSLCILALCAAEARPVSGASMRVTSIAQLQSAIEQAEPGDTITVANGSYTSDGIPVGRAGTAEAGITIAAESVGGVTMAGSTGFRLTATAAHVTIRGFRFTHLGQLTMDLGSHHCHVTRNLFELGNASRAIHVQGNDQEISFNTFQNKTSGGAMVSLDSSGRDHSGTQRTFIHHNHFLNHNFAGGNGGECIATWGQVTRVEHNLFEQCNGDPEIVTIKASNGFYRFNTFRGSTRGQLVLRFARNVVIEGNYLLGIRGMRIYGSDHKIINNYIEGSATAMAVSHGTADGGYLQVQRVLIAHNTIINGAITGRSGDLAPQGVTFANNLFRKDSGAVLTQGPGWSGITFQGNMVSGGGTAGDIPANGVRLVDAQLTRDGSGVYRLPAGSPAVNGGVGSHGVSADIDGQPRMGVADVGADEHSIAPGMAGPLTRNDVGPMAIGTTAPPPLPAGDGGAPGPEPDAGVPGLADAGAARDTAGGTSGRDAAVADPARPDAAASSMGGAGGRGGSGGTAGSGGESGPDDQPGPAARASGGCRMGRGTDAAETAFIAALIALSLMVARARRRS